MELDSFPTERRVAVSDTEIDSSIYRIQSYIIPQFHKAAFYMFYNLTGINNTTMLHYTVSVSYTHLDVYKRQEQV